MTKKYAYHDGGQQTALNSIVASACFIEFWSSSQTSPRAGGRILASQVQDIFVDNQPGYLTEYWHFLEKLFARKINSSQPVISAGQDN
jgi:hypothetical protein